MPKYTQPFQTVKKTRQLPPELWDEVDEIIKILKQQWLKNRKDE